MRAAFPLGKAEATKILVDTPGAMENYAYAIALLADDVQFLVMVHSSIPAHNDAQAPR